MVLGSWAIGWDVREGRMVGGPVYTCRSAMYEYKYLLAVIPRCRRENWCNKLLTRPAGKGKGCQRPEIP